MNLTSRSHKSTRPTLCLLIIFGTILLASQASSRLLIKTELISDRLVDIGSDNTLITQNKGSFYPAHDHISLHVTKGAMVTIRYYVSSDKQIYTEAANGMNSLSQEDTNAQRATKSDGFK